MKLANQFLAVAAIGFLGLLLFSPESTQATAEPNPQINWEMLISNAQAPLEAKTDQVLEGQLRLERLLGAQTAKAVEEVVDLRHPTPIQFIADNGPAPLGNELAADIAANVQGCNCDGNCGDRFTKLEARIAELEADHAELKAQCEQCCSKMEYICENGVCYPVQKAITTKRTTIQPGTVTKSYSTGNCSNGQCSPSYSQGYVRRHYRRGRR